MVYSPLMFNNYDNPEKMRLAYLEENCTDILGELVIGTLVDKGFLTAAASANHHGNYEGGLFDHSINVALTLAELTQNNNLIWQGGKFSPWRVGILHDLCKIDTYKPSEKEDGGYEWDDSPVVKGHGIKSVIYAQSMGARLNPEEKACIIYHMGAFTPQEEWKNYTHAVKTYPNVLWTHTADMVVSQIMEV